MATATAPDKQPEDRAPEGADEESSALDRALERIMATELGAFGAGAAGFLVLVIGARDTPTTGAAALMLVLALGCPPAVYALVLEPALAVWPRARATRIAALAALASLPIAMAGAVTALVFLAVVGIA